MRPGIAVARALAGSWRPVPPPPDLAAASAAEEQLLRSGAGGLAWWRISQDHTLGSSTASRLSEAFRLTTILAKANEERATQLIEALRDGGVEPLLFKGWDCSRMYPHRGMRPHGDVDLCVRPSERARAEAVLEHHPYGVFVDLQVDVGFRFIDWMTSEAWLEELFARSRTATLNGVEVRVLGDEDRLRTLALHAFKGGCWVPRSLCDVAVALETRPEGFSWETCLTADPLVRDWVYTSMGLARRLLGADLRDVPGARETLPNWLMRDVLGRWDAPYPADFGAELSPLPGFSDPLGMARGILARWPGPIQATLTGRSRFGSSPRMPLQLADVARRSVRWLTRSPAS